MRWIDDLLDFWFGDRGLSDAAEAGKQVMTIGPSRVEPARNRDIPVSLTAPTAGSSASSLSPLPDIPEMYLRHIPCEPCPSAVEEAQRVVRTKR